MQESRRYILYKPSYSQFCLKFRCRGNIGHPGVNLNYAVKQPDPKTIPLRLTPKGTSLAENASFDVLIDKIRPAVFAVGDDKKNGRKGKGREGTQSHKTLYFGY